MSEAEHLYAIKNELRRIREALERMEKTLPGGNQEALKRDLISLLTSEHTHAEYK